MAKYWIIYFATYALGAISVLSFDWAYAYTRRRRRAKEIARRLLLLQEFAKGLRVA